ncbi:MAG: type II secretion system protein GspH [Methylobacter sp.]|nr:MAG: type II secretion system protein GspH [Methylobacter sp.]
MQNPKGFTLIELLIVIVLIGIISSMAMLSMNSGNQRDQQKQEAERLLQLFQLASQEAIIRGMPVALEYYRHGYRFMTMNNGQWHTEIKDDLFKPRTLHPQLSIDLQVEKQAILLRDQADHVPDPQIVFTPDGDISLFQITIALNGSDETFTLTNTLNNGLVIAAQTATSAL